jgi:hypothetical protein
VECNTFQQDTLWQMKEGLPIHSARGGDGGDGDVRKSLKPRPRNMQLQREVSSCHFLLYINIPLGMLVDIYAQT